MQACNRNDPVLEMASILCNNPVYILQKETILDFHL